MASPAPDPAVVPEPAAAPAPAAATRIYRHRLPVRVMHWVNVVCLSVLLMSGLGVFNAHPHLYWGAQSTFASPWLTIGAADTAKGPIGFVRVGGTTVETTGVLGLQRVDGKLAVRAFPAWATVPSWYSLAMSRTWHFFFAWLFVVNGACYVAWTLASRHLARDLWPTGAEWRGIGRSVLDHLRLRHPTGDAARRYNVLQMLAYLGVIFVVLPVMVLTGLAMSPRVDAVWAGWVDLFGGRQSARTLHFLCAALLVLFVVVHVVEVFLAGVWNEMRSMVTGWYALPRPRGAPAIARGAAEERTP